MIVIILDGTAVDVPRKQAKGIASCLFVDSRWHSVANKERVVQLFQEFLEVWGVMDDEGPMDDEGFSILIISNVDFDALAVRGSTRVS